MPPPSSSPSRRRRSPAPTDSDSLVLTPREAARLLRCRPETVRQLCRAGEIRYRRLGRRFLIHREAVERWLLGEEQEP